MAQNLKKKIKLPAHLIEGILLFLHENASIEKEERLEKPVCRGRDDDRILGLALKAKEDAIVTGDADLLILKRFRSIPIPRGMPRSPRQFWEYCKSKKRS